MVELKGGALFEELFKRDIEHYGSFELSEIEYHDDVTCYDTEESHDEWWIEVYATFRYQGKKYGFNYKKHVMTADSEWDVNSFHEVKEPDNVVTNMINNLIKNIEEEYVDTWEEIIESLEAIKREVNKD